MNYVLVQKLQLIEKGVTNYGKELTDGRVVIPANMLKTVSGLTGVDIVSLEELNKIIEADEASSVNT